jgi:hypothetical protein
VVTVAVPADAPLPPDASLPATASVPVVVPGAPVPEVAAAPVSGSPVGDILRAEGWEPAGGAG